MTAVSIALPSVLEDGLMVWDPDGCVVDVNDAMARLLRAPRELIVGSPSDVSWLRQPGGGVLPEEQLPARRVARTHGRVDQEYGIALDEEDVLWVAVRSAPTPDGLIVSLFTPITEAEAKARAAARITTLVDESPDLVWMFDASGIIEYASPSVAEALGLRQDEVLGRLWRALTHPEDVPTLRAALADAGPDEPRTKMLELRLRTRDGDYRTIQGQATLRFLNGRAIAVEITGRDITRTRAAEDRGRKLSSQLEALVAATPNGTLMIDELGKIAVINEQACSLLELAAAPAELVGADPRPVIDAIRRLLAEPDASIERLLEISKTREPVRFVFFECKDGRRVGFDFVPLADGGRLWSFRDVTQFKVIEEEQRNFLATMSHEIKTPLSGIAGAAELLVDAGLPKYEQELAQVISDAAQSLTGLLRDVLDVSRAEAGREEGEASDYDPRRLLSSIAGVLRPSLRGRNLELTVDVDPHVPDALRGDPARVRQIVLNLASNAVKYTEEGHARIHAHVDGDRLKITVSDTGRGIAAEDLQRLFEPWTRTHTRAWAGTGLGLSIARRLARAMEGDVTVVSTLGEGSAFTLELPLQPGEATPDMGFGAAPALSASKVLVAEDDAALRRLIGMQLQRLGVTTVLVEHGQAAVDRIARESFDAVLLDLRMPVMGGLEAAERIRALDDEVPMLALTADTAAEDVARCRAAGMDGHLAKPISLPALRTELDRRITPVLDDTLLDELADNLGGRALVDQMLAVYHSELPGRLERLATARTPEELREAAHALRSPSAGFGIARLASRLRRVEAAARKGIMAPLHCVDDTAAQADRALTTRLQAAA
ncbi:response regulator [Solirubrobacter sp. CPCC 204708]|uniref:histidine kinase n=1 Tax=Solirubrobacter deserti TaxID=2282478 RepID=A0ABT4RD45_9ACTN|nr:ATP-binding protein [Solirubrobacter deserti]MBE2317781.1 response regulator [Solirubrobacter deserti]MDA0136442.1 ATP-binding protein [Solirubrobacter deserti]